MSPRVQSWCRLLDASETVEEGLRLLHKENLSEPSLLPVPPTDMQMLSYVDTKRSYIVGFGMLSSLPLSVGLWLFAIVAPVYAIFTALITSYLMVTYFGIAIWGRDLKMEDHLNCLDEFGHLRPRVDVYLPCCGESMDVLQNTYHYVSQLDWPCDKLNVYILDDGNRPSSVKALVHQFGFRYIRRPDVGVSKKAGNLRHAFANTTGELILVLDADFVPRSDFLKQTVPYFYKYPDVAILQTPQFFQVSSGQHWIERAAGSIQELFYRLVQQNRQRFNASVCVGSCAVYRRKALEPHGGTALVLQSEDVFTGFLITNDGYKVRYLPLNLSMGQCPDTASAYFSQNMRWCGGSIALTTSRQFWQSNLLPAQKMAYFSGCLYYTATALSVFSNALPGIYLVFMRPALVYWFNIFFAVPSLLFPYLAMRLWNHAPYGFECNRIRYIQYSAHLFAIKDRVCGTHTAWVPTGATTSSPKRGKFNTAMSFLLHVTVIQLVVLFCGCVWRAQEYPFYNFIPSLLLESFNTFVVMQVFHK
ncbi:nucleotide-diphospho-sugar transferase [Tribonema minus]|uniref:Nucleotide-diphospho-sugar transferase n=1 Tax=Tribonema minus TaxID=303371 RepID=A0A835Z5C3_9STRA|nr:nucleotide-diphospho-sugar transferase [Tribonema minus]